MQKLAYKIAESIALDSNMDDERKQVIAYGLGALIQMITLFLASAAFGWLFHCLIEAMAIFWTVGLFKASAGGAHARTSSICTCISLVSIFIMSLIARYVVPVVAEMWWIYLIIIVCAFAIAFWAIYALAPVASANKPITRPEKRRRLRKQSFISAGIFMLIAVILCICGQYNVRMINISISLCMAMLWQSFMLTKSAEKFIASFDSSV